MAKTLRPEHYGRGFDGQWPDQVQHLFQRCLPRTPKILGLANSLAWSTRGEVVYETQPNHIRTEEEIEENFDHSVYMICKALDEAGITYEYLSWPKERQILTRLEGRWELGVEIGGKWERIRKDYEPFYLGFSKCIGTELPNFVNTESTHALQPSAVDWMEVDLHYLDAEGDIYMGRVNGAWKMKKGSPGSPITYSDGHHNNWIPYSSFRRDWENVDHPDFRPGWGRVIWKPFNGVILFPKRPPMPPRTLNYP